MRQEFQIARFLTKEEKKSGRIEMKIVFNNAQWHRQQRLDLVKKALASARDDTLLEELLKIIGPGSWYIEVL